MYFKNNQNVGNLLLFVVSHVVVKMAESFATNTVSRFRSPNSILPNLCKAAGIKRKTAHCLRVTCVSKLFNSGVEEKLIRERTGHRSNALFAYEKTSEKKVSHVSALLGAETKTENKEEKLKCNRYEEKSSEGFSFLNASSFTNCDVKIFVNEKK